MFTQRVAGRKTHVTDKLLNVHVNKIAKSLSKGWTKLNYQFDNFLFINKKVVYHLCVIRPICIHPYCARHRSGYVTLPRAERWLV